MQFVVGIKDFIPAFAVAVRLRDGWPRSVVALDIDLVGVLASDIAAAKLPVHRVIGVVAIASVDNAVKGLQTLVFIEATGFAGELQQEGMLVRRADVVRHLGFPAHRIGRRLYLVAEVLVILIHPRRVGIAFAAVGLPALELVVDGARRTSEAEDLCPSVDHRLDGECSDGFVAELVGVEVFPKCVRNAESESEIGSSIARTAGRSWCSAIEFMQRLSWRARGLPEQEIVDIGRAFDKSQYLALLIGCAPFFQLVWVINRYERIWLEDLEVWLLRIRVSTSGFWDAVLSTDALLRPDIPIGSCNSVLDFGIFVYVVYHIIDRFIDVDYQ